MFAMACLAVAAGVGVVVGCPGTTAPAPYTPYTGVTLDLASALGGLRCGTGPGQLFKYSAVVWHASPDGGPPPFSSSDAGDASPNAAAIPIASDVWDCFADGIFENLPATAAGDDSFYVEVFGYSTSTTLPGAFTEAGAPGAVWCPGGLGPGGQACQFQVPSFAVAAGAQAQWRTTCLATEAESEPVTASCAPLAPFMPDGAVDAPAALGSADAQAEAEAEAPFEAGADAGTDATVDATVD
jgi:hypothetical protein